MTKYVKTILKVAIHRENENPVFGEGNTFVSVEDEAAGPFLVIEQNDSYNAEKNLRMDYAELLTVVEAAKVLMDQIYVKKAEDESNEIELTGAQGAVYKGDYVI